MRFLFGFVWVIFVSQSSEPKGFFLLVSRMSRPTWGDVLGWHYSNNGQQLAFRRRGSLIPRVAVRWTQLFPGGNREEWDVVIF